MIIVRNLHKSFGKLEVLRGIDCHIKAKEVVVVIGPSGSGKSTFLRCLNKLEEPTSGEIVVDDIPLNSDTNVNAIRREVGMVFQRFNLFPHMTALQNIMLAPGVVRKTEKRKRKKTRWSF